MTAQEILDFLETFCVKVTENESPEFVEKMMDDHNCIEFNEEQYYVPDSMPLLATEKDEEIRAYIIEYYLV